MPVSSIPKPKPTMIFGKSNRTEDIFLCTNFMMQNRLVCMTKDKLIPPSNQTIKFRGRMQKLLD